MKILLVEDDEGVRTAIDLLFNMRWPDARVLTTHSGNTALSMVTGESPDAIILDLGLPDISGFEVLRQLRHFSSVPVIILTARKEQTDIDEGFKLGADDYMTKPFKNAELLERVQKLAAGCSPDGAGIATA